MFLTKFDFWFVFIFIIFINITFNNCEEIKNKTEEAKLKAEEEANNVAIKIKKLFKIIDKNKNEKIEKSELIHQIIRVIKDIHNRSTHEIFTKVDTDNDEKVSLNEYFIFEHKNPAPVVDIIANADNSKKSVELRKRVQLHKKCFNTADINSDGFLNFDEYLTFINPNFFLHMAEVLVTDYMNSLDSDKDGAIDKDEHLFIFKNVDTMTKESRENAMKKIDDYFLKHDKDKNGKIDRDEYYSVLKPGYQNQATAEAENLLKQTDTDADGNLSFQEFEKNSISWLEAYWLEYEVENDKESLHHIDGEL